VRLAHERADGQDLDPGLAHVAHEPGDALVLETVGVRSDEHLLEVGQWEMPARAVSSYRIICCVSDSPRPPYSRGHEIPA
jgi:hypothetical protein